MSTDLECMATNLQNEIDKNYINAVMNIITQERILKAKAVSQIDNNEDLSEDVIDYLASKI